MAFGAKFGRNFGGTLDVDDKEAIARALGVELASWLGSVAPTVGQKPMATSIPVVLASDQPVLMVSQNPDEYPTYSAVAVDVSLGSGKSLLGLFNPVGSGYSIQLREVYIRNSETGGPVTGVVGEFRLYTIRTGSPLMLGGTPVTPVAHDSDDQLPSGLICSTGSTVTGEDAAPVDIMRMSTDEVGPSSLDQPGAQLTISNYLPARVKRDPSQKPFTLRPAQGIHLKYATASSVGSVDVIFIFTKNGA